MTYIDPALQSLFVQIAYIVGVFALGKLLIHYLTEKAVKPLVSKSKKAKVERKRETITRIVRLVGNLILYTALIIMSLRLTGITTTSLLTGASITGLVFGLGAQSLIKDVLAGFFMLLEDQYDIGDLIQIGDIIGIVRDVTMRSLILENQNGHGVYIPHGSIGHIINHSRK